MAAWEVETGELRDNNLWISLPQNALSKQLCLSGIFNIYYYLHCNHVYNIFAILWYYLLEEF